MGFSDRLFGSWLGKRFRAAESIQKGQVQERTDVAGLLAARAAMSTLQ
jgi:hypothetical protein